MFSSLHLLNSAGRGYELGTSLIEMEDDGNGYYVGHLTDDQVALLKDHRYDIYISMMFINRLYHHTFYTGNNTTTSSTDGADLFVLEENKNVPYKSPIPVENFMVFKINKETSGWYLEKNTEMLEMHYPNIYRIKDSDMTEGDTYSIFYFYYNNPDLEYTVLFDFYFKFLLDIFNDKSLEEIINNIYYNKADLSMYDETEQIVFMNTFNKILAYQTFHHQYGDSDFINRYLNVSGNEDKEPIEYKDETLKEWIRVQPWVLRDYVLEKNKLGSSYHLFTNTLDLSSRIRTDTSQETGEKTMVEFDEARYVFAFANEREFPVLLDCRVFVDGILVGDVYQQRKLFMDYFYIPTKYVTNDSYIELEIFPRYEFEKEIQFSSLDENIEISIAEPTENIYPTVADIIFEQEVGTGYRRYSKDLFKITSHYARGNFEVTTVDLTKPVEYTRLSTFDIQPKSEMVINKPLKLKFSKVPVMRRFVMDRSGYTYISIGTNDFQFSYDYIRIFRNGRLIPKNRYKLVTSFKYPQIIFMEWFDKGDVVYIDITPYRYTQIYHKEKISKEETLIDLREIINKPFDIRYYDVYMNGRKLSLNNVFAITPWNITLVNLKSDYNLDIYERERDWEYFGLDYTENIYYFTLTDMIRSGIVHDEEFCKLIKDRIDELKDPKLNIYPNTFDEEPLDYSDVDMMYPIFHIFYYDELIPKTYVNPDRLQFIEDVLEGNFKDIIENYKRTPQEDSDSELDKLRRERYPGVICLDPDIIVEYTGERDKYLEVRIKDKADTDYTYEDNTVILDVERVKDETEYSDEDNPLVYSMDNQAIASEGETAYGSDITLVYEVGHTGDIDQILLDTKIEINNEGNIEKKGVV